MTTAEYNAIPKLTNPDYNPGKTCVRCGNNFNNPKNSPRKSQVIWIRKVIRTASSLFRVHGSVCATCNDKLATIQIGELV